MSVDRTTGDRRGSCCAEGSTAASEPLAGTASAGARWLVVERSGAWGRDAVADTELPIDVRARARGLRRPRAPRAPARPAGDGDRRLPGGDDRDRRRCSCGGRCRARSAGSPGRRRPRRRVDGRRRCFSSARTAAEMRAARDSARPSTTLSAARRTRAALAVVAPRRPSLRSERACAPGGRPARARAPGRRFARGGLLHGGQDPARPLSRSHALRAARPGGRGRDPATARARPDRGADPGPRRRGTRHVQRRGAARRPSPCTSVPALWFR